MGVLLRVVFFSVFVVIFRAIMAHHFENISFEVILNIYIFIHVQAVKMRFISSTVFVGDI